MAMCTGARTASLLATIQRCLQTPLVLRRCYHCCFSQGACGSARRGAVLAKSTGFQLQVDWSMRSTSLLHASTAARNESDSGNPFYEKYREKLEKVQGPSSEQLTKLKASRSIKVNDAVNSPHHSAAHVPYTAPPSLDSVMHVNMIQDKSVEEITKLWREYHKTKDCISAVIPADTYLQLHAKALHSPFFLYPLPQDEGYEFIYAQFSGHRCYFTSLIHYQMYLGNAPVCLTLTHYTDLQEKKGIVLMAGELDTTALSTLEAQFLVNQLQLYYASSDPDRYALVREFNHNPEHFEYKQLVEQLQNSGIQIQQETSK